MKSLIILFCTALSVAEYAGPPPGTNQPYHKYTELETSNLACQALIQDSVKFCSYSNLACLCSSVPAIGTMAHCLIDQQNNSDEKINWYVDNCNDIKKGRKLTLDQVYAQYENSTSYLVNSSHVTDENITHSPVQFDVDQVHLYCLSYHRRFMNFNKGFYYGTVLVCYWIVIVLLAGIEYWTGFVLYGKSSKLRKWFQRYISLPAVNITHDSDKVIYKGLRFIVPTRLEILIMSIWLTLVIIFTCEGYQHTHNNAIWPNSMNAEIGRLVADRSALLSIFCIPLLITFSGRNNILQFVSGWSYSRMLMFHRWIARATFCLILIHAVAMSVSGVAIGRFVLRNNEFFVRCGITATCAFGVILVEGLLYFRRNHYQVFVTIHITLAIIFIITGWLHTKEEKHPEWFYAAVAIWGFDICLRIVRLAIYGTANAQIQILSKEMLKINVSKPHYWKSFPGSHCFIYFLLPGCFWQSHPFTIVDSDPSSDQITFCAKIKEGATRNVQNYMVEWNTSSVKVLVEGPYGIRTPIDKYEVIIFIAGGIGIPGLFNEAINLVRSGSKSRIRFYWIIRNWESINWFYTELLKFDGSKVEVVMYVRSPPEFDEPEKPVLAMYEKLTNVADIRPGEKPIFDDIIQEEIKNNKDYSTCFVACGCPTMVDEIRYSIVKNMHHSSNSIQFYDDLQIW